MDIGLEYVAVAATRVVKRPPRCGNKGVQKTSMSIKRLRESLVFVTAGPLVFVTTGVTVLDQPFKKPEPLKSKTCLENK